MAARFKELCLDSRVPDDAEASEQLGRFWAALTGCVFQPDDGTGDVAPPPGGDEGMGIAICPVPEQRTVKQRVHLDVHVRSVDEVTGLGGTVLTPAHQGQPWTVCADPEGGELCAFVREGELPAYRTYELNIDAADPERIARWWGEVFGLEAHNDGEPWWWVEGIPGCPFESWVFAPVPEPKTVKNRMHWDLYGETADFLSRGATHLWDTRGWTTLADPEGNEFCVFGER
ncbi:MAG: VOC family protein [Marmoricola sp.]